MFGEGSLIHVWDIYRGDKLETLNGHDELVRSVAFSPNGQRIASSSGAGNLTQHRADNSIRIWDVSSGRELLRMEGHTGPVTDIKFALDGKRITSGSTDGTVRVWDALIGAQLQVLRGIGEYTYDIDFSPDN